MAITNPLKDFIIKGIKELRFSDSNGDLTAIIDKLQGITITDETASSELRGGMGNPVIVTIKGDRTCKLQADNSVLSMEYLKILTGNSVVAKTVNEPKSEKKVPITSNTATLTGTPLVSANITVYLSNANGENLTKLTKVASAPTAGQFSISGSVITVASGTTGVLNAYYYVATEMEVLEATAGTAPIYKCQGIVLLQGTSNGRLYKGIIDCPAVQVSPSVTISGKNSSDAPDANSLELDLLSTSTYPYAIQAVETATENI